MNRIILILVIIVLALLLVSAPRSEAYTAPSFCDRYLTAACKFRDQYPMSSCSTQCYQGTYQFDPLRRDGLSGNLQMCQAVCNSNVKCGDYCDSNMNCTCPTRSPTSTPAPVCDPDCPIEDVNYLTMEERAQYCAWLKENKYTDTQCGDRTSSCRPC